MKKILVPTDFSEFALNAAKLAASIAKKFDARIYFLHVVSMPQYETGIIPGQSSQDVAEGLFILKKVKMDFQKLISQDFLKDVNFATAIQYDGVYESVVSQAKKHDIDLIVMGTHGSSGYVNDFFIGSNTDKIVRLSETPVLTIRDEVVNPKFDKLVFASDFGDGVGQSFRRIADIADKLKSTVELVRIITRDDFYFSGPMLDAMDLFAKEHGLSNYNCHVYAAESVQLGINEFAQRKNADMVTTITHGRRGLARLFNGSVTSDIMKSSPLPVLSIRAEKK
ncbi:universal stress protein [Brumimicrobium glaciale]|jgi:nucleotide-binding universal stress UspA family protein|uniref:Universal stress protein n=1 Tax=Brumimicrobium glaciale TaxID=200475 RepID=A0A4Q4KI40_9FLAO|nr:universal stress protein [Brumimicrobium glaciale]RYM32440.1 universal stress protein [Brumimicrobium glaciale]